MDPKDDNSDAGGNQPVNPAGGPATGTPTEAPAPKCAACGAGVSSGNCEGCNKPEMACDCPPQTDVGGASAPSEGNPQ